MTQLDLVEWGEREAETLATCEQAIEHGLRSYREMGAALATIRDGRLYRQSHGTFEDYCRERWGMTRQHAYYLMDGAAVAERLSTIVDTLPANEAQVRPLTRIEPEHQTEVWTMAVESAPNGKMTAAHVQRTVDTWRAPIEMPAPYFLATEDRPAIEPTPEPSIPEQVRRLPTTQAGNGMAWLENFCRLINGPVGGVDTLVADFNGDPVNNIMRTSWLEIIANTRQILDQLEDGLLRANALEV